VRFYLTQFVFLAAACTLFSVSAARAMNTSASFDLSYSYVSLNLQATKVGDTTPSLNRSFNSATGYQIDYNVALYDLKTVVSASFLQFLTSNSFGDRPISRVAIAASYHFLRMNGQRLILDNGVEGRVWGVSPALELSLGFTKLTINDQTRAGTAFSASMLDAIPRLLIELPLNSSLLIMFRAGLMTSLSSAGNAFYNVSYSGPIFNLGVKLTSF
jgi:hypothetical protein